MPEPNLLAISKDIENDIKKTFNALDAAHVDLKDKINVFRFYISGLRSGYNIVIRNSELTFRQPLIDNIIGIYDDYDERIISREIAWKMIAEILA